MAASSSVSESGIVCKSSSTRLPYHPTPGRRAHDIFLSHSGAQKGFVKELYKMLSPQYVTFFDIESLPLTESFPGHIFDAARRCKLAVVVLSNEFLCSKWPMLELCAFVEAQSVKILPLFFKLSPTDLKDEDKLKVWLRAWELHEEHDPLGRIKVSRWKKAFRELCSLNGLVFQVTHSEQSYIEEIMSSISRKILPRAVKYEESGIEGKDRLCKIILAKFEVLASTSQKNSTLPPPENKVHVLGMYGTSGSGKSTISRCFYEEVRINFEGKTLYLELPTNPSLANLVQTCKDLLNHLTNSFHITEQLQSASELRQMYHLFRVSNLRGLKLFLMLDNISADIDSIKLVQVILRLCVGPGSKVLLVARTQNVLRLCQDNLGEYYVCYNIRVPSLNEKEALKVLLQRGGGVGLDTSYGSGSEKDLTPRYKEIMEEVVPMSGFEDPGNGLFYLPVVLHIMGHRFRECRLDHAVEMWGKEMHSFWRKVEGCKKDAVRELVQESFGNLSSELQLLFLDLALFYLPVYGHDIDDACAVISLMHDCNPGAIESEMYSLQRSCFLSMHDKWFGQFCVHDVFLEFAASIPESSMYYVSRAKGADEVQRNQLQAKCHLRALDFMGEELGEELDFSDSFSSVKILRVRDSKSLKVLGLAHLTSLVSLEIVNCPNIKCIRLVNGNDHNPLQSLRSLKWSNAEKENISVTIPDQRRQAGEWWRYLLQNAHCWYRMLREGRRPAGAMIGAVGGSTSQLRCLTLENTGISRLEDMSRCWPQLEELQVFENHLQHFEVGNLPRLKRFYFSDSGRDHVLEHINRMVKDNFLALECPDDSRMLAENLLVECPELEDVRICSSAFRNGISLASATLSSLCIRRVPVKVLVLDDASLALSLEQLYVSDCWELTSINFECQFGDLRHLYLWRCHNLAKVSGLHRLSSLQSLYIDDGRNLAEIHGLEGLTSLQTLEFSECTDLAEIHGLEGLTSLQLLTIARCANVAEIHGLEGLTSLEELYIGTCNLAEIHGLEGLTSLSRFEIDECTNLVEIHGLEGLTSLHKLYIGKCTNLAEVRGLEGLISLEHLKILECSNLAEIHGLEGLTSLEWLLIWECSNLAEIHGLEGLISLEHLEIKKCTNLAEIHGLEGLTSLERLEIQECSNLANLAEIHGLEGLISLEHLKITKCTNLAEIHGFEGLTSLEGLEIQECSNLAEIHGFEGLTSLKRLEIQECSNLAEIHGLEGNPIPC